MCRKVFFSKHNKKTSHNEDGETGKFVSKENIFIRDALVDILGSDKEF